MMRAFVYDIQKNVGVFFLDLGEPGYHRQERSFLTSAQQPFGSTWWLPAPLMDICYDKTARFPTHVKPQKLTMLDTFMASGAIWAMIKHSGHLCQGQLSTSSFVGIQRSMMITYPRKFRCNCSWYLGIPITHRKLYFVPLVSASVIWRFGPKLAYCFCALLLARSDNRATVRASLDVVRGGVETGSGMDLRCDGLACSVCFMRRSHQRSPRLTYQLQK